MTSAELKHEAHLQRWAATIQECRSSGHIYSDIWRMAAVAQQQPCGTQHQAVCDGPEELAVCKCAGRRTIQRNDLQLD